ncbi:MAG: hypothetical protein HFI68_11755 [Lachnospiraceae bacterium]|nr:hypothetical protein [Lachnospiraceae bacterium]
MESQKGQGSISVFFAMLLVTIFAIICTSLESARYTAVSYLAAQAEESALESVFAGYYNPVWKRYHLFFMADGPGFLPMLQDYLSYYENPEKGGGMQGTNLYEFHQKGIKFLECVTAVDQGGEAFLKAIVADTEAHGKTELAESLLGQSELVKEAGEVSEYIGGLLEYEQEISAIEESYKAMESQGKHLKSVYQELEKALKEGTLTADIGKELLEKAKNCATETSRQTAESYAEILKCTKLLEEELELETEELLKKEGSVGELSYEQMETELENLKEYTREDGSRRNETEFLKELLNECAKNLADVEFWEDGKASVALQEVVREGGKSLSVLSGHDSGEKQKSSLLEVVKSWKSEGILDLVLEDPGNVSDKTLPAGDYPSETAGTSEEGGTISAQEKGMAVLYTVSHFGRFGRGQKDTVLDYEAEYILGKSENDKENLAVVAEKLLAVRTGMNFLYLLGDGQKQAEAELLAAALVGFTGIYPLVKLMKGILLGAWAFTEAVCDVRILFQGGQVPLVKTVSDWNTSLEKAAEEAFYKREISQRKGVWDYEGYLCILLLMGDTEHQCFRMMDLIEANLRKNDSGFFMENCISSAVVEVSFQAEPRFFHLPMPGKSRNGAYIFYKTAAYSYYD